MVNNAHYQKSAILTLTTMVVPASAGFPSHSYGLTKVAARLPNPQMP